MNSTVKNALATFSNTYFIKFLNYIRDNEDSLLNLNEVFHIILLYKEIQMIEIPKVTQSETLAVKGLVKLGVQFEDAFGNIV